MFCHIYSMHPKKGNTIFAISAYIVTNIFIQVPWSRPHYPSAYNYAYVCMCACIMRPPAAVIVHIICIVLAQICH